MQDISPRLMAYLKSWFGTSTSAKSEQGIKVTLTFEQFLELFSKRQLAGLQKAIDRNRLRDQQKSESQYALVLTWQSYNACSTRVFSADTALVCSRMKSKQLASAQKGDKLRLEHCEKISETLSGMQKTPEHRAAISKATKGTTKAPWSPQRKAAARERALAREQAKRAAKAGDL